MSEINFDDIEKNYTKAILKDNKKKNSKIKKEKNKSEKKTKETKLKTKKYNNKKKYNETKIIIFSLILSLLLIFLFLNLITPKKEDTTTMVNTNLIDEVKYISKISEESSIKDFINSKNKTEVDSKKLITKQNIETEKKSASSATKKSNTIPKQEIKAELKKYYAIQVAASKNLKSVEAKIKELLKNGEKAYYVKEGINQYMYKIIIDKKFKTRKVADTYAEKLKNDGIIPRDSWIRYFNK